MVIAQLWHSLALPSMFVTVVYSVRLVSGGFILWFPRIMRFKIVRISPNKIMQVRRSIRRDWDRAWSTIAPLVVLQVILTVHYRSLTPIVHIWLPYFVFAVILGLYFGWLSYMLIAVFSKAKLCFVRKITNYRDPILNKINNPYYGGFL